jgi:hypothetical protein
MAGVQKVIFTIPINGTDSNDIGSDQLRNCRNMLIIAPGTLTGVVTAQAGDSFSYEVGGNVVNWADIQSPPGTDVTVVAGKATVFVVAPFPRFRLHSSLAESAARQFIAFLTIGE